MMFKLIFFLVGLAVAILFSAFNIGNTTDISFGFLLLKDVPVFLSTFISFFAGAIFTLPFAFYVSFGKKNAKKKLDKAEFIPESMPDEIAPQNPDDSNI